MRSDKLNISGDYYDNFTAIDFENMTVLTTLYSFEGHAEFSKLIKQNNLSKTIGKPCLENNFFYLKK
jgi:hypothetical protein